MVILCTCDEYLACIKCDNSQDESLHVLKLILENEA